VGVTPEGKKLSLGQNDFVGVRRGLFFARREYYVREYPESRYDAGDYWAMGGIAARSGRLTKGIMQKRETRMNDFIDDKEGKPIGIHSHIG
jgi:hypothetical protein